MNRAKKRILVVEDDPYDVERFRRAVSRMTSALELTFISSRDVVDYFETASDDRPCPAAVLLDLTIPQGLGLWTMRWLASSSQLPQVPIHVFTGSDAQEREAFELGAREAYAKTTDIAHLQRIFTAIERQLPDLRA